MESGKLYNGVGTHGNSNTGFYVDSGSKFSLGDKLVWDGSTLTVEGAINILGGGAVADQLAALNAETGSLQSSIDTGLASVSSSVSGAFSSVSESIVSTITEVSSSTALRIMTDATGSVLDIPASPAGDGLYLNYPYMGFYGKPTITDTTYVVTAPGGSGAGYYIDGVQRATVELQAGYTYRFDTSDGSMGSHPFRFSTDSGNSSAYTTGVTVGSGYVDIVVTSSTP